jgi:L-seryl-tRNA(Ser) seleniumtransferase
MTEPVTNLLREIPSVDGLLKHAGCETLLARYNREYVTGKCREIVEELRAELRQGKGHTNELKEEAILIRVENRIRAESLPGHVRVVNATGTILHTNLGRALLPQEAIDAMTAVAGYPVNLEYDLAAGKRGSRHGGE